MANRYNNRWSVLAAATLGVALPAFGQTTYTWAPGGVQDASGTWSTSVANWIPGTIAWPNNTSPADHAEFGNATASRTVTLSGTINVNSIIFNDPDTTFESFWTLSSGTLNLLGSALLDPRGNNNYRIDSVISGSAGLTLDTISGSRNIQSETRLGGDNTYTGVTTVRDSTLSAFHDNALGATGTGNDTLIESSGRVLIGTSVSKTISEDFRIRTADASSAAGASIRSSDGNHTLSGNVTFLAGSTSSNNDRGFNVSTNHTFTINGSITTQLVGTVTNPRLSFQASGGGSSRIVVNGVISQGTGTTVRLLIDGSTTGSNSGIIELAGANTFSGQVNIRRGTLLLSNASALGTGSEIITLGDGGLNDSTNTLRLLTNGPYTVSRPIQINSASGTNTYTAVLGGNSADASTFSGNISINDTNAGTYQLTAASGGTVTFSGVISDGTLTKSISKTGAGTVILSNANTFDGGVAVSAGTLLVNNTSGSGTGTGSVSVSSGATLGGNGRIGGATTINSGGKVAPGTSAGKLTINNNFTLAASTSVYEAELGGSIANAGTDYDQLVVSGSGANLNLGGGRLVVQLVGVITTGTSGTGGYKIVSLEAGATNSGSTQFGSLQYLSTILTSPTTFDDGNVKFTVHYDSSGVYVNFSQVPEPASLSLLALGAMALRRRRQR
jgi:autotransporter-associated beta strand protein